MNKKIKKSSKIVLTSLSIFMLIYSFSLNVKGAKYIDTVLVSCDRIYQIGQSGYASYDTNKVWKNISLYFKEEEKYECFRGF